MIAPFPPTELRTEHLTDALLYANRVDALACWPSESCVAEVGVAFGTFTAQVFRHVRPRLFDAYDIFRLHEIEVLWGKPAAEVFDGKQHKAYYEDRFSSEISRDRLRVFEGDSSVELSKRRSSFYDVIYVDGDHSYSGVIRDAQASARVLKPGGMLVFNDYILYDKTGNKYGVVPVVNDLCDKEGWTLRYLALQREMFCDVALVRSA